MSDSNNDDMLDRYLNQSPQRREPNKPPKAHPPAAPDPNAHAGLNPLDLLNLPTEQRDVINWLSRRKQATFEALQTALDADIAQLTDVLAKLKAAGHIKEALINGEIFYRVVFGGKVSRAARGLPESIWQRVDLDNTVFLRQVALFRGLTETELREIASKLDSRRYRRNEVIIWQGGLGEGVYLIKSGVVGITRLLPEKRDTHISTYLRQGDLLGEYGLLFEQNIAASATATALSDVEVLVLRRQHMLELLKNFPSVAVAMVELLAQRLLTIEARSTQTRNTNTLCLVFSPEPHSGGTTIGSALAMELARTTQNSTVYTEHPVPALLPVQFDFLAQTETHNHSGGFDIIVPQGLSGVPLAVRTTLVIDRLMTDYANIVVGVSGTIDETVLYMLERADQVVLVIPSDMSAIERYASLYTRLKAVIRPDQTNLVVVCNRADDTAPKSIASDAIDLYLPRFDQLPPLGQRTRDNLPETLSNTAELLAKHMGRTNQIGVYIPAHIAGPTAHPIQYYVEQTSTFLNDLFGGSNYAPQSTVEREKTNVSGETLYIVHTSVTKSDMEHHLGAVLAYIERLKTELDQDAMALEINHNVMLV